MRLLILSDLHLEFGTSLTLPPEFEYDAVVLAGDIHSPGREAVQWAQRDSTFGGKPVVLMPGNREFYGCDLQAELDEMRRVAAGSNVHVLDRDSVIVAGVRFLGCTLWTDFMLPIRQADGSGDSDVGRALAEANRRLNDFQLIELPAAIKNQYRERQMKRMLRAEDTLAQHWTDRSWLQRQLSSPFEGPTVVVTHHAPAAGSVAKCYAADWLTPAFVTDLPDSFFEVPRLWVHGHTHSPFAYERGACTVVSNPRGYRLSDDSFENPVFSSGYVVEVAVGGSLTALKRRALLNPDSACGVTLGCTQGAAGS